MRERREMARAKLHRRRENIPDSEENRKVEKYKIEEEKYKAVEERDKIQKRDKIEKRRGNRK